MKRMIVIMIAALVMTGFQTSTDVPNYPFHAVREAGVWMKSRNETNRTWINIAHRGASGYAPENTMAAFEKALEMGADLLELDVQLSTDGHVVVIHDYTVERTTDGQGKVEDLTLEESRKLDAGAWYRPEFKGEVIPTLEEVLEHVGGRIGLLIGLDHSGYAADTLCTSDSGRWNYCGLSGSCANLLSKVGEQILINNP